VAVYRNVGDEIKYTQFGQYTVVYICQDAFASCGNNEDCVLVSRIYCSRVNPEEWDGWVSYSAFSFGPLPEPTSTPTPGK
jgi:hypothetical protein